MSSPYLEAAAIAERERDELSDQLAGMTAQRDEMAGQFNKLMVENLDLRQECQRLLDVSQSAHDRLLRGDDDEDLLTLLESSWESSGESKERRSA